MQSWTAKTHTHIAVTPAEAEALRPDRSVTVKVRLQVTLPVTPVVSTDAELPPTVMPGDGPENSLDGLAGHCSTQV